MKATHRHNRPYAMLLFFLILFNACSSSYYREIRQHYDMKDRDWKRHLQFQADGASMIIIKDDKLLRSPYGSSASGLYKMEDVRFEEKGMRGVLSPAPPYMHGVLPEKNRLSAYSIPDQQREEVFNSLRVHLDVNLSGDEEMIYYRDIVLTESFKKEQSYFLSNSPTSKTGLGAPASLLSVLLFFLL